MCKCKCCGWLKKLFLGKKCCSHEGECCGEENKEETVAPEMNQEMPEATPEVTPEVAPEETMEMPETTTEEPKVDDFSSSEEVEKTE